VNDDRSAPPEVRFSSAVSCPRALKVFVEYAPFPSVCVQSQSLSRYVQPETSANGFVSETILWAPSYR
jgi:hypothetical protein